MEAPAPRRVSAPFYFTNSWWKKNSRAENDLNSFSFFFFHHYLTALCSFFAKSAATIKDIKASGDIFIISNHIVFTAPCLWGCSWRWKYLELELNPSLFIRRRRRRGRKEKPRWKRKKQETKRENKLSVARRSPVISSHLTLWWGRGEEETEAGKTFWCVFFFFPICVLSPRLSRRGPLSPEHAEATRRCRLLMGFWFGGAEEGGVYSARFLTSLHVSVIYRCSLLEGRAATLRAEVSGGSSGGQSKKKPFWGEAAQPEGSCSGECVIVSWFPTCGHSKQTSQSWAGFQQ